MEWQLILILFLIGVGLHRQGLKLESVNDAKAYLFIYFGLIFFYFGCIGVLIKFLIYLLDQALGV